MWLACGDLDFVCVFVPQNIHRGSFCLRTFTGAGHNWRSPRLSIVFHSAALFGISCSSLFFCILFHSSPMLSVVYSYSLVFCSTLQYCSWLWTVHQQYYIPLSSITSLSYPVPLSSIVQDCEQFISSIISLSPPRPLYSIVSPLFQSGGLFFKALAQGPVQIEHAHIYTRRRSFQLSNYDTVLCQKKK